MTLVGGIEEDGRLVTAEAREARAARLARDLQCAGVGPGQRVVVHLPRSAGWVIAVLAIWRVGASFVPVDPAWPTVRKRSVFARSGAWLTVGPRVGQELELGVPDTGVGDGPRQEPHPDDEAYVFFTSGSTGAPRGVRVAHRGLPGLMAGQVSAFSLYPDSRAAWVLSPGFDASVSDVFTTLAAGATLVPAPPAVLRSASGALVWLANARITHADLPPALLARIDPRQAPGALTTVVIGGESCAIPAARAWARQLRLVNVYGPTEATVCTSLIRVDPDDWTRPELGDPLRGIRYVVRDEGGRPVPAGAPGELTIAGEALALGYLDEPAATAARFVTWEGERWFLTRDRVLNAPRFPFLGRIDRIVKVYGQLVAPEEVELALTALPGVRRAAVTQPTPGGPLEAEVEADGGGADLRSALETRLPVWMIPRRVRITGALPEGAAGKVQHSAAGSRPGRPGRPGEPGEPGEPDLTAERVSFHWTEVLNIPVDPDADLAALGRDSVAVIEVLARAEADGIALVPERVATAPTVRASLTPAAPIHTDWLDQRLGPGPRAFPTYTRGGRLLLTGATGALGGAVLTQLIAAGITPICLLRRHDPHIEAAQLIGDLGRPRLGLAPEHWRHLADEVGVVLHLGAEMHLFSPVDALWPTNVTGTRTLIELCAHGRAKHLHHLSSLGVFASLDPSPRVVHEGDGLPTGRLIGGYAQSKWAAERAVCLAVHAGLRATVYRPAYLCTPGRRRSDSLSRFLRGVVQLGGLPDSAQPLALNLTTVDAVAASVVSALLDGTPGIIHPVQPRNIDLADLVAGLNRAGRPIPTVPLSDWLALPAGGDAAFARLLLGRSFARDGHLAALDLFLSTGLVWCPGPASVRSGMLPQLDDAGVRRLVDGVVAAALSAPPTVPGGARVL